MGGTNCPSRTGSCTSTSGASCTCGPSRTSRASASAPDRRLGAVLHALDLAGLRLVRARAGDSALTRVVAGFSTLGEHAAGWLALGALGATADRRRRGAWIAAGRRVALAYLVNTAVKLIVRRRR